MRFRAMLLSGLVLAASACDDAPHPADECVEVRAPDGWLDADPPRWVELWRSGGPDSGVELALPIMIQPAPDGRLAIADFQLGLGGLGPDGEWMGSLTRPGEGPGEVRMPLAVEYAPDGTLAILDFVLGKVVFLDPQGDLVRETRVDPDPTNRVFARGELNGVGLAGDGTAILIDREPDPATSRVRQMLLRLRPDGSPADTLAVVPVSALGGAHAGQIAPGWPRLVAAISAEGRIAYAGHEAGYEIEVLPSADERLPVCRDVEPEPLRADETEPPDGFPPDRLEAYRDALAAAARPERPAPISRLFFGRDGRLWVERERFGLADFGGTAFTGRAGSSFDVFDAENRFLGEIRAPRGVRVMAAAGDTVWGIEYGAFDVPSVVAYRLER